jgi:hypothetical protein
MRKYITSLLLICTLPIGELHHYYSNDKIENWILCTYRPMAESWNVYFVSHELIIFMYFLAWYYWKPNIINRTTMKAFLLLSFVDILFYFYNYKLGGYSSVYFWFTGFWLIAMYSKVISNYLWQLKHRWQ